MYIFIAIVHFNRHWTAMHVGTGIAMMAALPFMVFVRESHRLPCH